MFIIDYSLIISAIANRLQHKPTDYLKRMYFDAIAYHTPALQSLISLVGEDCIMFGTDNPFFPPPGEADVTKPGLEWPSTKKVYTTMQPLPIPLQEKIISGNAKRIFNI